jgi:actin related protein 2/3 complex subunit 1A/1B
MGPKIDGGKRKEAATGNAARNKFVQMDSKGQQSDAESGLNTTHQNTITSVKAYKKNGSNVQQISSTGVDGLLVIWDLLSTGVASMRL